MLFRLLLGSSRVLRAFLESEVMMRVRVRPHPIVLPVLVLLMGCASTGRGPGSDPNVITNQQFTDLGPGITAYEAIEQLRPTWLTRGAPSVNPGIYGDDVLPRLHVDQTPFSLDYLDGLRAVDVESARFISAQDATTRYGTGYPNGLIDVRTRGSRPG